ncbi:Bulb-type lectin domain [Dillenia turbinata]|uniref:Bulb-type lectin domain n=1 Tax=Dillenia turbinata TaxID=194707 RepID=A0AAN8ZDX5_9MAGN
MKTMKAGEDMERGRAAYVPASVLQEEIDEREEEGKEDRDPTNQNSTNHMDLPLPFHLRLMVLVLLPCLAMSQNFSRGSSITAGTNGSLWESPSGDFAFGFHEIPAGSGSFLLAIWFNKIDEKPVVRWANNGNPVQDGSKIQLTSDGRLVLSNHTGQEIWSAGNTSAYYAAMLDTGNLVLADEAAVNLWESFDQPTDTFLPTQPFKEGRSVNEAYHEESHSDARRSGRSSGPSRPILVHECNLTITCEVYLASCQLLLSRKAFCILSPVVN